MIYIDDFFKYQTSIGDWIRDINLTINAGAYSDMSCATFTELGFYCQQLIQQVEVAYIIFKQCGLKKQHVPLQLFATRTDYINYTLSGIYTCNDKLDPADTLSKVFSYQPLSKWYEILDDVMMYLTEAENSCYDRFGDKIVLIKELLFRLAYAFYHVYERGGVPVTVPPYFIAQAAEAVEQGASNSVLEGYINTLIDKEKEKVTVERGVEGVAETVDVYQ